ncbi:hypothetical protein [Frankia sp. Cr1]|uniref:hypothetical protein n=1 Tax=Frankia sp. Cr1 TaxID=3073931 RepID=UPI002AD2CE6F|nr:hypothetical protein [Frankia sp. Cr1]
MTGRQAMHPARTTIRVVVYVRVSSGDLIRERTASGKHARITQGGWGGGDAPYGYRLDRTSAHPRSIWPRSPGTTPD